MISRRKCLPVLFAFVLATPLSACLETQGFAQAEFRVAVGGVERDPTQPMQFTTRLGWTVTLTHASLSTGPLYFRNAPPSTGTDEPSGRVVAQVLDRFVIDTLDPTTRVLTTMGTGFSEPIRSAELRLAEAQTGPIADAAGANRAVARVAGTARKDNIEIAFDGTLQIRMQPGVSDYQWFLAHQVRNVPTSFTISSGGTLTMRIDPRTWFDFVVFDTLEPLSESVRRFETSSATAQLRSGVASPIAVYSFVWSPPPE